MSAHHMLAKIAAHLEELGLRGFDTQTPKGTPVFVIKDAAEGPGCSVSYFRSTATYRVFYPALDPLTKVDYCTPQGVAGAALELLSGRDAPVDDEANRLVERHTADLRDSARKKKKYTMKRRAPLVCKGPGTLPMLVVPKGVDSTLGAANWYLGQLKDLGHEMAPGRVPVTVTAGFRGNKGSTVEEATWPPTTP